MAIRMSTKVRIACNPIRGVMMNTKRFLGLILVGLATIGACAVTFTAMAQVAPSPALTGQVSSQEEGPMEGVLVSAKRMGSTVTLTVVSDAQGRYDFPQNRLEPGLYAIRIRAVGYELDKPVQAEVTAENTAHVDLELASAQDLWRQL